MYTKAFQRIPAMRKRRGDKVYEYGYVWITLPPEAAGKPAIVRVFVLEEEPIKEQLLAPLPAPERKAPAPEPQPEQRSQPAQPVLPPPAQPAPPAPIQPLPPAQPLQPLVPLQRERLNPELDTLLRALRTQPERAQQFRDLLPFEGFTLDIEEEREERRKRRWPWLGRG